MSLDDSQNHTSLVGWLSSTTLNCATPPSSVVTGAVIGAIVTPATSPSRLVTVRLGANMLW